MIKPMRNKVVRPAPTRSGSVNCTKACAIELNPENQVTSGEVCSGAFKKWTTEYRNDVMKIDINWRPVFKSAPRTRPRKNASSMIGTKSAAAAIFAMAGQLITPRMEKSGVAIRIAAQQNSGTAESKNPAAKSRQRCGFRESCKSSRFRISSDRASGQSMIKAATRSAGRDQMRRLSFTLSPILTDQCSGSTFRRRAPFPDRPAAGHFLIRAAHRPEAAARDHGCGADRHRFGARGL